jgi:hypothetical protein
MRLLIHLGVTVAAAALVLSVSAPAPAQDFDDLADHIAQQAGALGQVMDRLRRPEVARAVVETALKGDPRGFEGLFDGIEVEVPNKCVWVADTVEKLTSTFVGFENQCWLRDDLTLSEWFLYVQITRKYFPPTKVDPNNTPPTVLADGHILIPPGAYFDELNANGLLHCGEPVKKYSSGIFLFPGRPERFCLGKP